jgi:hypothetical protein
MSSRSGSASSTRWRFCRGHNGAIEVTIIIPNDLKQRRSQLFVDRALSPFFSGQKVDQPVRARQTN